jgi:hypothetical protein
MRARRFYARHRFAPTGGTLTFAGLPRLELRASLA